MGEYRKYERLPTARLTVGGGEGQPGHENGHSRLAVTVMARVKVTGGYGPIEEVQIWLTIPQVVVVVRSFFSVLLAEGGTFARFLERLLLARWRLMTSDMAKPTPGDAEDEAGWMMPPYHKAR